MSNVNFIDIYDNLNTSPIIIGNQYWFDIHIVALMAGDSDFTINGIPTDQWTIAKNIINGVEFDKIYLTEAGVYQYLMFNDHVDEAEGFRSAVGRRVLSGANNPGKNIEDNIISEYCSRHPEIAQWVRNNYYGKLISVLSDIDVMVETHLPSRCVIFASTCTLPDSCSEIELHEKYVTFCEANNFLVRADVSTLTKTMLHEGIIAKVFDENGVAKCHIKPKYRQKC